MGAWRLDAPHRESPGAGSDLADLRDHGRAHVLLYWLARGLTLDVVAGAVHVVAPDGEAGLEPVPLDVLDAIEAAGWVRVVDRGVRLTERGLCELRRWAGRRYTRRSWEIEERRLTGEVLR